MFYFKKIFYITLCAISVAMYTGEILEAIDEMIDKN